jgi:excisionase family DNA binding protein
MLFDENTFRAIIRDEVRKVVVELLSHRPASAGEYAGITEASKIASVAPQTIRRWVRERRLTGYHAGRVLRVKRSELEAFLASPSSHEGDFSPEALAERDFLKMTRAA